MTTFVGRAPAGVLEVRGKDRIDLLHRITTNDLRPLAEPGRVVGTVFTNEKGRIVDWVSIVSRPQGLLLRTSGGRAAALAQWIERFTIMEDVAARDVSAELALVVVYGDDALRAAGLVRAPASGEALQDGDATWVRGPTAYGMRLEGLLPAAEVTALLAAAAARGATAADAAALETARLLAGVPSPEHEFKDEVNPLELRISAGAISWNKGCYIGQEVIARLDSYDKLARQLMGFETSASVELSDDLRLVRDGKPLGRVTSVAPMPAGGSAGLAVVKREAARPGDAELVSGAGTLPVRLVDRPFWTV